MILMVVYMPLVYASNEIYTYIILKHTHFSTIDLCTFINLFDMIFQVIVQQKLSDGTHTVFITDSAKFYLKKTFLFDLISNMIFFILLLFPKKILKIIAQKYLFLLEQKTTKIQENSILYNFYHFSIFFLMLKIINVKRYLKPIEKI